MCEMCGMFSFFTIYIYLRQKNPDEIGDFCEGRAEGGCRIKSDKKNGTCGEVWSNE